MRGLPHYRVDRKHGGSTDEPLSLNRYTYYANKALRYTDPSGHLFGAVLRFIGGGIEFITQKFIEKREKVDWKAVLYEGVVGGVSGAAGKVGKAEKTIKTVAKGALKTGVKESIGGFVGDVGCQVFVEDKSLDEVDYGQAAKAGATAGVTAPWPMKSWMLRYQKTGQHQKQEEDKPGNRADCGFRG